MTGEALGIVALPIEGDFLTVEVRGFDPSAHSTDAAVAAWLRELLWQHGVICIRLPAKLEDSEMRSVVQMFGPIKDPVGRDDERQPGALLRGSVRSSTRVSCSPTSSARRSGR